MKTLAALFTLTLLTTAYATSGISAGLGDKAVWRIDFFDDFDSFNANNWQDQMLWVNNEYQCYVPDNQHGTREVSEGTLKLKVINIGGPRSCDNLDKHGKQHPPTQYVAGRIASKKSPGVHQGKVDSPVKG